MAKTHYEALGITPSATAQEVKSAYRKLVLKHHPDRSKDPASKSIFLQATEAYEVLSDDERRRRYDEQLKMTEERRRMDHQHRRPTQAQQQRTRTSGPYGTRTSPSGGSGAKKPGSPISVEVSRLTLLFNRGQFSEAERLAKSVLSRDPRQPIPYAILGDIARMRRNIDEAQRMYAYATQMDPRNPVYQRRYEQLLARSNINIVGKRMRMDFGQQLPALPMVASGVVIASAIYIASTTEEAILGSIGMVSTWTLGLLILLFLCGVTAGACLSIGNYLDNFEASATTSTGRSGPTVVLGLIAIVNFWAAAMIYLMVGFAQKGFNYSTTRMVGVNVAVVLFMTLGAALNGEISPFQVFLWGGNLSYMGAIVGWLVADAFKNTAL